MKTRFHDAIMDRLDERIMNEAGPAAQWFMNKGPGWRRMVSMLVEEIGAELDVTQEHVAMPWDPDHIVRKDAIDGLKLEGDSLLVWYRGASLPLIVQEDAEPHFVALKRALGMTEASPEPNELETANVGE